MTTTKWVPLAQYNRMVHELTEERDEYARRLMMVTRSKDIIERIREARRGDIEQYVDYVLEDCEKEILALRGGSRD